MAAALMEPSFDGDKLSYEIFSILESRFLFGYDDPKQFLAGGSPPETPPAAAGRRAAGKVRVLSIDGGGGDGALLAGAALARLESSLAKKSGDPSARIADFFDLAAGSGSGGLLAALLFSRGGDGRPLLSAAGALGFLAEHSRSKPRSRGIFRRRGDGDGMVGKVFGDLTLKDTVKPVLVPCYDVATGAPLMFSRADAVESDGYDFLIREVCAATCAEGKRTVEMRSVDGRNKIRAVGGGVATANPAAAAITHVLNNRVEFPFADGVEDLVVVSIGAVAGEAKNGRPEPFRIAGESAADMVDQSVAMAFGRTRTTNYVRIQAEGVVDVVTAEAALGRRSVESVLFRGKRVTEESNAERLERVAGELVAEHERRRKSGVPTVVIKGVASPRTSSATTATTVTVESTVTSSSTASMG